MVKLIDNAFLSNKTDYAERQVVRSGAHTVANPTLDLCLATFALRRATTARDPHPMEIEARGGVPAGALRARFQQEVDDELYVRR